MGIREHRRPAFASGHRHPRPQEIALRDYCVEFRIPILWISGPQSVAKQPQAAPEEEKEFARKF